MSPLRLGLVLQRGRMVYGQDHGVGLTWQHSTRRAILRLWNAAACFLVGHDRGGCFVPGPRPECSHCCAPLRRTPLEAEYARRNAVLFAAQDAEAELDVADR